MRDKTFSDTSCIIWTFQILSRRFVAYCISSLHCFSVVPIIHYILILQYALIHSEKSLSERLSNK